MDIAVKNLSFTYGNDRDGRVLDCINLSVKTGEAVGITGVSGGGKSTLLKLISGLYDVSSGAISIGDFRSSHDRRIQVSMVMQNAALFPASVRDNITCGHCIDEDSILRACELAQLSDWLHTLPDGLDSYVGERSGRVSGGQAQRIAIARAIVKDAPVILLDEPTSALDNETGSAVIAAIACLTKGKTVLHVSHQIERLADYDRILRMEGGRLHDP